MEFGVEETCHWALEATLKPSVVEDVRTSCGAACAGGHAGAVVTPRVDGKHGRPPHLPHRRHRRRRRRSCS